MDETTNNIQETLPKLSRKVIPQNSTWKVNNKKVSRYSPKGPPNLKLPCQHYTKAYRCTSLSSIDIMKFHGAFYKSKKKLDQDNFIIKHTKVTNIQRRRPVTGSRKGKNISIIYFARRRSSEIPVCRQTFLHILGLKKGRVSGVVMRHFKSFGAPASENRGGDRKKSKFAQRKNLIKMFIKKFKPLEIHYCRNRIKARQYLSSDLNISKLYKMFKAEAPDEHGNIKLSYFRRVFNTSFNIGFGTPRTDMCSTCIQLKERIKYEKNEEQKRNLMVQTRIHKLRAKAFYKLLQENSDELLIFSFDCQKNQPIPKVPDQKAYYSRQLYVYNLTIVVGHSKSKLTPENVFIYTWTEDLLPKASNEIASCVFHCLCKIFDQPKYQKVTRVRLVADGCSGQNKNISILGMACKWFKDYAPNTIKSIDILFPVVGHSFLPPDRVFAYIEKEVKKHEVMSNVDKFIDIFKIHGTVFRLGIDVNVSKWKEAASNTLKATSAMHFPFQRSKRFFLRKNKSKTDVLVRAEESYNNILRKFKNICKAKKNVSNIIPENEQLYVKVNQKKINDVKTLLQTHFGDQWALIPELAYFKEVIERPEIQQNHVQHNDNDEADERCRVVEEIPTLFV